MMKGVKILANDGLAADAVASLREKGFEVITDKVAQEDLASYINQEGVKALLVRSATKVRESLFDACPNLEFVGRGGVGMDNIDVAYGRSLGRTVTNTPNSSTHSVAESVFAHLFSVARFLHHSNRIMPIKGQEEFSALKKSYASAFELKGKTLGIVGFGRIGQATAKIALGLGMRVLPYDPVVKQAELDIDFLQTGDTFTIQYDTVSLEEVFEHSDAITFHVPMPEDGKALVGAAEMEQMKDGVVLINTARGGILDEEALLDALAGGKVGFACLDVFEGEPKPKAALLNHDKISVSPHIGGSTQEAQQRIGEEMVERLVEHFS